MKAVPGVADWSGIGFATVGARLTDTTMSKVSLTESAPSLAVTVTDSVPRSAVCGVPEKVREAAVKVSHEGRAVPSPFVAV